MVNSDGQGGLTMKAVSEAAAKDFNESLWLGLDLVFCRRGMRRWMTHLLWRESVGEC